jgi:diguanylate cyclase (GGDEF)-like protein
LKGLFGYSLSYSDNSLGGVFTMASAINGEAKQSTDISKLKLEEKTLLQKDLVHQAINMCRLMEDRLIYAERHDNLTKIPNRYYLAEFLREIYNSKKCEKSTLLIVDIDNFKIVNDTYGHEIGDLLLVEVTNFIKTKLRENDFLARLSGDGFGIVLQDTNLKASKHIAQRLLEELNQEVFYIDECKISIKISVSVGITLLDDAKEVNHVFSYADAALYEAKEKGKNRVIALNDDKDSIKISINNKILALIHDALKNDRFVFHLQPIYKTNNKILHQEILLRMLDENNNFIFPSTFIPLAERYGLMPLIDRWVVKNALRILKYTGDLNVFINLSGSSLSDDIFLKWIEQSIRESDICPGRVGFEITETAAIKDLDKAKRWICKLQALGCCFALDDFGVGFSSFSYLNMLPVNYLKIDGSFVRDLDSDPTKLALVQAMNAVAHALGKQTIAEFVENENIWRILNELGVDCGQGYYLGGPKPI